jgi:hypothetical protein
MSCHQNAGQNNNLMLDNKFFENEAKLKHLAATVKSRNCTHEEIKSILNSRNV